MDQLIKTLIQSQKLKDIGAVVRGADLVFASMFQQFGKAAFNPLVSSETKRPPHYYVDHPEGLAHPDSDLSKSFDHAENQPRFDKDLESLTYNAKPGSTGTSTSSPSSSSQDFQSLNKPFRRSFSTSVRQVTPSGQNFPKTIQTQEELIAGKGVMNPHLQRTMNNPKDRSLAYDSPSLNNGNISNLATSRKVVHHKNIQERKVPSSSIERTATFAGLGLNLAASAVGGVFKNMMTGQRTTIANSILTEENAMKISQTFSRMRGIPLKLGQVLSMQEEHMIPRVITQALERAQKSADIMPQEQLYEVLARELGSDWQDKFEYFDMHPIGAASIGQVHRARTKDGIDVAVKIQYPGVAQSINSDINSVRRLLVYPGILPRSFFMEDILRNISKELLEECDYTTEAQKQTEFRQLLLNLKGYYAPRVIQELSTRHVLTQEFIEGINLDECAKVLTQEQKNKLGEKIFEILMIQLFEFGFMQTDPNPANFFYDPEKDVLNLIDFGAAQSLPQDFVKNYMDIIYGSAIKDSKLVYKGSKEVGFLTGEENRQMMDAHVSSVLIIGEPFAVEEPFDFGNQNVTKRIYDKLPVLLEQRIKPPPQIVYSVNRMLSGGYLMCGKLGAVVHVSKLFKEVRARYLARGGQTL